MRRDSAPIAKIARKTYLVMAGSNRFNMTIDRQDDTSAKNATYPATPDLP